MNEQGIEVVELEITETIILQEDSEQHEEPEWFELPDAA